MGPPPPPGGDVGTTGGGEPIGGRLTGQRGGRPGNIGSQIGSGPTIGGLPPVGGMMGIGGRIGGPEMEMGGWRSVPEFVGDVGETALGPATAPPEPAPQPPGCAASVRTTGRAPTEPAPRAGLPSAGGQGPVLSGMNGLLAKTHLTPGQRSDDGGSFEQPWFSGASISIMWRRHCERPCDSRRALPSLAVVPIEPSCYLSARTYVRGIRVRGELRPVLKRCER
jgi:hypothetical protein